MIIGIGGVSNSGKSSLAKQLKVALSGKTVAIICQDDFVYPEKQIPQINDHIDWELPDSIDFDAFRNVLLTAAEMNEFVIAEGLMIYHDSKLIPFIDLSIFLEISKSEFITRKKNDLRWGFEPEWYINHIWDAYQKFGQPPVNLDVININADKGLPEVETILRSIQE